LTALSGEPANGAILHVAAGLDPRDGGPAYTVPRLCQALGEAGASVRLHSVAYSASDAGERAFRGYSHVKHRWDYAAVPVLRSLRASSGLADALRREAARSAVIHDHGLWLLPNVYAGRATRRAGIPLVVAPRGMLSKAALRFSSLKKRLFWAALQRDVFRHTACFHATSEQEYREIRDFGLNARVAIIPNGIDIPASDGKAGALPALRTVLSLGRIHPKKGLDQLLHAWRDVEAEHPDWRLRIAGPAEEGHDQELKALASRLRLMRAAIEPPLYDAAKNAAFAEADLFVLPTRNENFAVTVAEALAHAVPVISTKGAPWSGLVSEGCGWWIDHGREPLVAALREAMALPRGPLHLMGEKGRGWMQRDFSWTRVADDMRELYAWLAAHAERPSFVR
jgi:glycosyltransferase involved in cell wall biosynthesis